MSIPISKYPYTDLHEMNMDWVIDQVKTAIAGYEGLSNDFNDLKTFVEDFIAHLDIDQAVRDYLDELIQDGTITQMIQDVISQTFDLAPTQSSTHGVVSGGVYDALTQNFSGVGHNMIYRGKNLGSISNGGQANAFVTNHGIDTGDFTDLYIGDYVKINDGTYNEDWIVAGFDYYLTTGSPQMALHHVILIPKTPLIHAGMNASNDTTGAYLGSNIVTSVLPSIASALISVLGSHLMQHYEQLSSATASGASSSWTNTGWTISLLSECQISGIDLIGNNFDVGSSSKQLPLFRFVNPGAFDSYAFWTRTVGSATKFAAASATGTIINLNASDSSCGVLPIIILG